MLLIFSIDFVNYNFIHDEFQHSTNELRKHLEEKEKEKSAVMEKAGNAVGEPLKG